MIIAVFLAPMWAFVTYLIDTFGFETVNNIPNWYSSFHTLLSIALTVFPVDVWIAVILNLTAWMFIHLGTAIVSWVIGKIPLINIRW